MTIAWPVSRGVVILKAIRRFTSSATTIRRCGAARAIKAVRRASMIPTALIVTARFFATNTTGIAATTVKMMKIENGPPAVSAIQPSDRDLQIKGEMLTCRHFNGFQHDECKAGVNYRELAGAPALGCMTRIPCTFGFEPKGGPRVECSKMERPSRAEAEQTVAAGEAAIERHMRAFRAAHDDAKAQGLKRGRGGAASIACPICGGMLTYVVAAYNGHMHAKCETEGCVSWME